MSFIGNRPDSYGYSTTAYEQFSGNSVQANYNLSRSVSANSDIFVTVDNVPQVPGEAYYISNLNTLTFTGAPGLGTNNIVVVYRNFVQSGLAPAANTVTYAQIAANTIQAYHLSNSLLSPVTDIFTANGTTSTYVLSQSAVSSNSCTVTVNGIVQASPSNYYISGNVLTFASSPANNTIIKCVQNSIVGTSIVPIDDSVTSSKLASNLTLSGNTTTGNLVVTGTLTANIANTQITGLIQSNQIVNISNTQITGNIISSQITSVSNTQITGTITGSQISANTISNTSFRTGSVENYMSAQGTPFGNRNKIINGDMRIDQRNAGSAINSVPSGNTYGVDRWSVYSGLGSVFKFGQNLNSVTPPPGFASYAGVQNIATSSTNINTLQQTIEGYNFADFAFGTANAKTLTVSFWVYSSLSGLFGGAFLNAAQTRIYPFSFTVAAANTWQFVSVTIPGDTAGAWVGASNAGACSLVFCLGGGTSYFSGTPGAWVTSVGGGTYGVTGQVNLANSSGATFYLTGVQLEKGATATPFENRLYGTELALCQRYCQKWIFEANTPDFFFGRYASNGFNYMPLVTDMRVAPTVTYAGTVNLHYDYGNNAGKSLTFGSSSTKYIMSIITTIGGAGFARYETGGGSILAVAEL